MPHAKKKGNMKNAANPVEIQQYLSGVTYPAGKQDILNKAGDNGAPQHVVITLMTIMDKDYNSPAEVTREASKK